MTRNLIAAAAFALSAAVTGTPVQAAPATVKTSFLSTAVSSTGLDGRAYTMR